VLLCEIAQQSRLQWAYPSVSRCASEASATERNRVARSLCSDAEVCLLWVLLACAVHQLRFLGLDSFRFGFSSSGAGVLCYCSRSWSHLSRLPRFAYSLTSSNIVAPSTTGTGHSHVPHHPRLFPPPAKQLAPLLTRLLSHHAVRVLSLSLSLSSARCALRRLSCVCLCARVCSPALRALLVPSAFSARLSGGVSVCSGSLLRWLRVTLQIYAHLGMSERWRRAESRGDARAERRAYERGLDELSRFTA
jgi:hypothetical protein